jgi:sugar-specific transcriptional regulator TrmB
MTRARHNRTLGIVVGKLKILEDLARFGFTQYEAQAYMTLLQHGILSGYELASKSGVPRSRIYEVLQHLKDKSVVSPVHGTPVRYKAQSAEMLLKSLETDMTRSLRSLAELLPQNSSSDSDFVWNITERDDLLGHAEQLIHDAKSEILL